MYAVEGTLPRATQGETEGMVAMLQQILSKMENLDARLEAMEKRSHIQREKVPSDTSDYYSLLRAQLLRLSRGTRDDSFYDEFGNYFGPEVELDQESDGEEEDEEIPDRISPESGESDGEHDNGASIGWITASNDVDIDNQIVLAEDKKYYSTVEEVYGEDVEAVVMDDDEQERKISIKVIPMSSVLEDRNSNPVCVTSWDTLGHDNFSDEMSATLRLADWAVLIVDVAEGVMVNNERAICHAIQEQLPMVVVINKVDILIMELKLPPKDSYHKLRHTIEIIHISAASSIAGGVQIIDPTAGNVGFASATVRWSFTLQSFAKLYLKLHGILFDANKFASRLWGDSYYHPDTRGFKKKPVSGGEISFVQFVLEPLYKIYGQVIGELLKVLIVVSPCQAISSAVVGADLDFPWNSRPSSSSHQAHISFAGVKHMRISWVTNDKSDSSHVHYGTAPGRYNLVAQGESTSYAFLLYKSGKIHHVVIGPLEDDRVYYYKCGGEDPEFQLKTLLAKLPVTFAVAGDLGNFGWTKSTLDHIYRCDYDVHLLPRNLLYANYMQYWWDKFGKLVQPLTSARPRMVTEENHDEELIPLIKDGFVSYNAKWKMPYEESGSNSNLYYSFEVAGVHVVMPGSYTDYDGNSEQYIWLMKDLSKVNRKKTAWLVASFHVPWYNSNFAHQGEGNEMMASMEPLLYAAGVDIALVGHVHAYECSKHVYKGKLNPCGPVHITIGDGGNTERLAHKYQDPQPVWGKFQEMMKTATEPLNPSELPKMVEDLKKISKSYSLAITKVEESGEPIILGTEELYLDSITKDLRELYSKVKVKAQLNLHRMVSVEYTILLEIKVDAPKKKVKETILLVTELIYGGLLKEELQLDAEKELEMALRDWVMEETKDKNNAVEAYVYEMRNKFKKSLDTGQVAAIQWLNRMSIKKDENVTKYGFSGRGVTLMTTTWEFLFDLQAKYPYDTLEDKGVMEGGVLMQVNRKVWKMNITNRIGYKGATGALDVGC